MLKPIKSFQLIFEDIADSAKLTEFNDLPDNIQKELKEFKRYIKKVVSSDEYWTIHVYGTDLSVTELRKLESIGMESLNGSHDVPGGIAVDIKKPVKTD